MLDRLRKLRNTKPAGAKGNMKTVYEPIKICAATRHTIDTIATELLGKEPNRQGAAAIINTHGLGAHVGGHHVAIHRMKQDFTIFGPRLALVTSDEGDWL